MPLLELQLDHDHLLNQAAQHTGQPMRAVRIEVELQRALRKQLNALGRFGIDGPHPLLKLHRGRQGHSMEYGLEHYSLQIDDHTVPVVCVCAPVAYPGCDALYEFWAIPVDHMQRFHRYLRALRRRAKPQAPPPILPSEQLQRLRQHTVQFLEHGTHTLAQFDIAPQRGVLLLGEPGNGKTMACRWLEAECQRVGLLWRTMSVDQFRIALLTHHGHAPFELPTPGVVLFDDFDACVQDKRRKHRSVAQLTFLAELDRIRSTTPTVFLFTSNARFEEFDPAFTRPGRIDHVIHFPRPDATLRRRLLVERWHPELLAALDLELVVEQTTGLSFAELEEIKRLLVLHHFDQHRWDWQAAWDLFQQRSPDPSAVESGK